MSKRIGIIGAGKLGCAIATALHNEKYIVSGVYSRNEDSQQLLCQKLNVSLHNELVQTVKGAGLIFITVPDIEIQRVAREIAENVEHTDISQKIFLHMSGALTSDELEEIRLIGGYTGSLHPIQTFADKENGCRALYQITFGFEGGIEARNTAAELVKTLKGNLIEIRKEDKPIYHAAACMLSNYMVTLAYTAGKLIEKIGVNSKAGVKAFMPLMNQSLDNIELLGSIHALTGPISRGDTKVIEEHIQALDEKCSDTVNIYKVLGQETVELALLKGSIDTDTAQRLSELLK